MAMALPFVPSVLLEGAPTSLMTMTGVDLTIVVSFMVVLGIGAYLRKHAKTGMDFFQAGKT